MKTPSKFFSRKGKKNHSLLADVDIDGPKYYEVIAPMHNNESPNLQQTILDETESQTRDDVISLGSMPYQIAEPVPVNVFDLQFPETPSFQEDEWKHEGVNPSMNRNEITTNTRSTPTQKKDTEAEKRQMFTQSILSMSSAGDDIFDDLESVFEEIKQDDKFLSDILQNCSQEEKKEQEGRPATTHTEANSSNDSKTEDLLNAVSPRESKNHFNTMSKGILIVDPLKNGAVYHMDEDNKSLTDKDLLIIGQKREGEKGGDDNDDLTVMSSLTEVTYQKTKEERVKLILQHLKDAAATIPESNTICSLFDCTSGNPGVSNDSDDENADENNNSRLLKMKKAVAENEAQFSLTEDAGALFQSLVGARVDYGSFDEKIIVCITRIYLALVEGGNDNGLRCTYNEPKLSHDLGVKLLEDDDGQAVVAEVIPESTAERSGVKIGDKLSFSVPLNNTFQGYERACDFISRLELIGMRTSYRELFSMLLSKTSSGWPVAIVFRRQPEGMLRIKRMPFGLPSMEMSVDLLRATVCLHELITSGREFDYELESNDVDEIIRGNIESFMSRPRCHNRKKRTIMQLEPRFNRFPFVPCCNNNSIIAHGLLFSHQFRRCPLLTWYAENSRVILYLRITGNKAGTGLLVARNAAGSWSAPCSIDGNLPRGNFQFTDTVDCFVMLKNSEEIENFQTNKIITVDTEENLSDQIVITKTSGLFYVESRFKCFIQPREDVNELMYSKVKDLDITKILNGRVPHPDQSTSFFGALRRLEFPSTMYPHPTPPINLSRYTLTTWEKVSSCEPSDILEHPFDEEGKITLRKFLGVIERGSKQYKEDKIEIDAFMINFNRMLFDGVTVERLWTNTKGGHSRVKNAPTKALMKLYHLPEQSWQHATIQIIPRTRSKDYENQSNYQYPLQNLPFTAEEFHLNQIVSISKIKPNNAQPPTRQKLSHDELKKRQKRFVSFETSNGTRVMFYARTGKDASLLSCGLKLLMELVLKNNEMSKNDHEIDL